MKKIIIESIDLGEDEDNGFELWYESNKQLTKKMVLYGYSIIKFGIQDYINKESSIYETKQLDELKQKGNEELTREKERHTKIMCETVNMYENMIKQLKDSINIQDIRSMLEQEYTAKINLATFKTSRDVELKMSAELDCIKTELNKYKSLYEQYVINNESELTAKLNLAILQSEKDTEAKLNKELITLKEDLSKYKSLYSDIRQRYEVLTDSEHSKKIEDLVKTIENNEKEIGLLKKTTFAKGNKGEGIILQLLKKLYPSYEYVDVSKEKHAGDIHMLLPQNGGIIMIESKYKENITKQDVEKFIYDIDTMTNNNKNVVCGIFVSILTKNIPHIGDMKIDFLPSPKNTPMVFVGFENEIEFEYWFKYTIGLALELAKKHNSINTDITNEKTKYEDLLSQIIPLLEQIKNIKNTIERLRNNYMSTVNATILELELNIRKLFESICNITNPNDELHQQNLYLKTSDLNNNQFICSECNNQFSSKKALAGHMKAHKKN